MRVLVVEDEPVIALNLATMLVDLGHSPVGPAASNAEAKPFLDRRIDAAILDVRLPDGDCFQLAELLRKRGVKLMFTTGADLGNEAFGDAPVVTKPYDMTCLEHALSKIGNTPGPV